MKVKIKFTEFADLEDIKDFLSPDEYDDFINSGTERSIVMSIPKEDFHHYKEEIGDNNCIYESISPLEDQSQLEKEFRQLCQEHIPEIRSKIEQATKLLNEACQIADKHGIPFRSTISHIAQPYIPSGFSAYDELDSDLLEELTNVYPSEVECGGWQHSAVCW